VNDEIQRITIGSVDCGKMVQRCSLGHNVTEVIMNTVMVSENTIILFILHSDFLSNGYRGSFRGGKARLGRNGDHSLPSSAKVKNE
jgi:hypothetical protein